MPLNPPPIVETNLCLVTQPLQRSDLSHIAELTFALNMEDPLTISHAQTVINDFQALFASTFGTEMDGQVDILQPTMKVGQGTTDLIEVTATGATSSGASAGTYMPPQVCVLVKKTTGNAGRKNRGRTYVPFASPIASVAENGHIDNAYRNGFQDAMDTFLAGLVTAGAPMCIANKTFNQALPPHHVTHIDSGPLVVGYTVEGVVATQRRRLGR